MSAAISSAKELGPRSGRIVLASAVVLFAGAVVAGSLRFQAFCGAAYTMFVVFAFPVPVAVGAAVGLLSPRRGLASPSVWACIAGAVLATLLSGAVEDVAAIRSPIRVAGIAAAAAIAALSVSAARQAADRGMSVRFSAVVLLGILATALSGCGAATLGIQAFQTHIAPQVLLELDRHRASPDFPRGSGNRPRPASFARSGRPSPRAAIPSDPP